MQEKAEPVVIINESEIERIYDQREDPILKKLDFSGKRFELKEIDGLSRFPNIDQVSQINLSRNKLRRIDELNQFSMLETIIASHNELEQTDIRLTGLKKLVLKNNHLQKFPQNSQYFKNLSHLDISHNNIITIKDADISQLKLLRRFYFQHNRVIFQDSSLLNRFLLSLTRLTKLEEINGLDNPFISEYEDTKWYNMLAFYMITEEDRTVKINEVEYKPSQLAMLKQNFKPLENGADSNKKHIRLGETETAVKMQEMVTLIESCNNNPVSCYTFLQKLSLEVDKLMANPFDWTLIFFSKIPIEQLGIRKQTDEFFQNCVLFLNTQQSYMKNLLFLLARMTKITTNDFGMKCFDVINEVAKTSNKQISELKKILKDVCFKYMYKKQLEKIPLHVIRGLISTVRITEDSFLHEEISNGRANSWLDQMILRYSKKSFIIQSSIFSIDENILEFLSLACNDQEKVKQFLRRTLNYFLDENYGQSDQENMRVRDLGQENSIEEQGANDEEDEEERRKAYMLDDEEDDGLDETNSINFFDRIVYLFISLIGTEYDTQYIQCLKIITNACSCGSEDSATLAEQLLATKSKNINFIQTIEDELQNFLRILKQGGNTLNDGQKQISKEELRIRYEKFAELILTYGSIYHFHPFKNKELQENSQIINDLLMIISLDFVDPILLAAVCTFTRKLLDNQSIVENKDNLSTIKMKTQKLGQLLPYLGDQKYELLCKYLGQNTVNLMHQNDERIQNLINEIVLLVKWFSEKQTKWFNIREAKKSATKQGFEVEYESVSSFLEAQGRENNLFKCLAIPNDNVRLVIVECLMTVPIEQWKSQQICVLFNIANSYKSLGAGKTEKVLSNIFMIASKFCILSDDKTSKDFQVIYAENSVLDVQKILLNNMERDLREDKEEQEEKVELAAACVSFLISLSDKHELRLLAKSQQMGLTMKRCLLLEEQFLSLQTIPIEIERCWAGKYLVYLLPVLQGKDALFPYSYQSFRVLCRIADNIDLKPEEPGEDLKQFNLLYDYEQIFQKQQLKFEDRKQNELEIWPDMRNSNKIVRTEMTSDSQKQFQFAMNSNIIQVLINFLIGNNQSPKSMVLESELKHQFSDLQFEYELKQQMLSIVYKIRDQLTLTQKTRQIEKTIPNVFTGKERDSAAFFNTSNKENLTKAYIILSNEIDEAKLQEYADLVVQTPILVKVSNETSKKDPKKQFAHQDGLLGDTLNKFDELIKEKEQNLQQNLDPIQHYHETSQVPLNLRSLMVCALLRCIFALAKNAQDKKTLKQITASLEIRANVKQLSQLCDWAGWTEGNIAAKYLWVINFMLQQSYESTKIDYIFNYEMISKSCNKIIGFIEKAIQNEEKSPLTEDNKILIKELCTCVSSMLLNICKFTWNNVIADEGDAQQPESPSASVKLESKQAIRMEDFEEFMLHSNLICLENLMLKILPFSQFKTFVTIATYFMKSSTEAVKRPESPLDISIRKHVMASLTNLIGTYICGIHSKRQEIIRFFTYSDIFEKRIIRKSFIQQILDVSSKRSYEFILEKQVNDKNKQTGQQEKVVEAFHVHYRDGMQAQYQEGFVVVLTSEIRLLDFNHSLFHQTLQSCDMKTFNQHKTITTIPDKEISEILVTESNQRVILRLSRLVQNQFMLYFMSESDALAFLASKKKKVKFDLFTNHSFQKLANSKAGGGGGGAGGAAPVNQKKPAQISTSSQYLQWVCLNPKESLNRFDPLNVKSKVLLVMDQTTIYFLVDNPKSWVYFKNSNPYDEVSNESLTRALTQCDTLPFTKQQSDKINNYFTLMPESIKISLLKQVIYDQSVVTQVVLKTTSKSQSVLFSSDEEREFFRNSLVQRLQLQKWNQQFDKIQSK